MKLIYSCVSNEPSGHDHTKLIFSLRLLRHLESVLVCLIMLHCLCATNGMLTGR